MKPLAEKLMAFLFLRSVTIELLVDPGVFVRTH